MPALHTQRDREIFGLRQRIRQHQIWIDVDADNFVEWNRSKLAELRAELNELQEKD